MSVAFFLLDQAMQRKAGKTWDSRTVEKSNTLYNVQDKKEKAPTIHPTRNNVTNRDIKRDYKKENTKRSATGNTKQAD